MNLSWLKSGSSNLLKEQRAHHEPGITSVALENHWKQAQDVMTKPNDPESAIIVISHFSQMISFLRISRDDPSSWSQCKEFWTSNRCSDLAIKWLYELGAQRCDKDLKLAQTLESLLEFCTEEAQLFGYIISQGSSSSDCGNGGPSQSSDNDWDGVFFLSTILLELCISVDRQISESARKSFVLLIKLASTYPEFEKRISQEACLGITTMTISGLCASFAQLPTFQSATNEQLLPFLQQIHFIDSIVGSATDFLAVTITGCFEKNFLQAVILPALTQDEGSRSLRTRDDQVDFMRSLNEEIAVVTCYLQIVCENVTHPLLIKSLITFTLTHLLTTLLHRMNHPSTSVTVSTLSLLNVLLEFYCEDLWYEVVLRHVMSQNHLMVSQRYQRLPEVNFQDAALRFISFLPTSVTDVLGPEAVSFSYMQYVNSEFVRWCDIDGITYPDSSDSPNVVAAINRNIECDNDDTSLQSCSKISQEITSVETSKSTNLLSESPSGSTLQANPIYPSWKYRYDGTDIVRSSSASYLKNRVSRTSSQNKLREVTVTEGTEPFVEAQADAQKTEMRHPLEEEKPVSEEPTNSAKLGEFTTISLLNNGMNSDELSSIGIGDTSFELNVGVNESNNTGNSQTSYKHSDESINEQSDGYSSMESGTALDNATSFGPFIDCLFNHLANFTNLDPDVILMVTGIISTLAASRIPLITSLFLDHNLTLQPSFRSFLLVLNRIRLELDKCVRSQQSVISEVGYQLSRDLAKLEQENEPSIFGSNVQIPAHETDSLSSFGESFTDSLRNKINTHAFVAAVSAVFNRKPIPTSASFPSENNPDDNQTDSIRSIIGQHGYRLMGRPSSAEQGRRMSIQDSAARTMVTRAIYFTHWLLELSAIATELCWKRG